MYVTAASLHRTKLSCVLLCQSSFKKRIRMKNENALGRWTIGFRDSVCKTVHTLSNFHWDPSHTHSLMMHRNVDFVFTTDKLRVRLE